MERAEEEDETDRRARCRWGLMLRDAGAPRRGGRAWPELSRPETRAFSFPFQGGPSSYEETPGALGTGPERAAVWGDRRCGGGSSSWGGGSSAPSCVHSAQLPTGSRSLSPGERGCGGAPKPRPVSRPQTLPLWAGPRALSTGAVLGPEAAAGFL